MPDPKKPDDPNDKDVKVDPLKDLTEGFKEMVSEVKDFVAASKPATTAIPVLDKTEATAKRKADAQVEYEAKSKKANELIASGEGAEAMETYMTGVLALQAANAVDPEDTPQYKAGLASARKLSKADNKGMYDKYANEIEIEIAALPVDDRINPDEWDKAVNRVKAGHIDEILDARAAQNKEDIDKAEAQARETAQSPLVALRGRGTQLTDPDSLSTENLSVEQRDAAEACGLTDEKYVEACKSYDEHTLKGGRVLFMNEPTTGLKVKPGAF